MRKNETAGADTAAIAGGWHVRGRAAEKLVAAITADDSRRTSFGFILLRYRARRSA